MVAKMARRRASYSSPGEEERDTYFSKRQKLLLKKVSDISIMCSVEVNFIVIVTLYKKDLKKHTKDLQVICATKLAYQETLRNNRDTFTVIIGSRVAVKSLNTLKMKFATVAKQLQLVVTCKGDELISRDTFRQAIVSMLKHFFYTLFFKIYDDVTGLYDYDPPTYVVKSNVLAFRSILF